MNLYNLLGLPFDATKEEIRKAYFDAAKKNHPDLQTSFDLQERFIQIQNAYETLSDDDKRSNYNKQFSDTEKINKNIQINAYYSRSIIPLIAEEQAFYLLLDIFSPEKIKDEDLPSINLCIVLDTSTSMQGAILNKLKLELINLARLLNDEDIISIVTFSDFSQVILHPCKIKDLGSELSKIQGIVAGGSTEIVKGLQEGISVLHNLENSSAKLLYLITDGHTYGDEDKCIKVIREASEEGIIFQAIGVGKDWNDEFLDTLSKIAGGETQFVNSSDEMYKILNSKIQNFGVLFSKSVRISFNLHPNVKLNYAFRLSPDLSRLETSSEIQLGNLYSEKHLRVIFEFIIDELPDEIKEIRLSQGSIKVEIPTNTIFTKRYFYDFKRPVLPRVEKEKIPPVIINALSSLSLYRIQEKAREDVREGNYNKATKRLQNLASHLVSKGNHELAKTIIQEVDTLQKTNHFSELGIKKIKYGTRSLLMLPEPYREDK